MNFIDLRSDTVTQPTEDMRKAIYSAEVGDDVYGDDPTIKYLEEFAAQLVGKESALFVPSGTFGNQLALFTHCPRGSEVLLGDDCHIVMHEVGAASVIAGVQLRCIESDHGMLSPEKIQSRLRGQDIHFPETSLICIENAHSNGRVIPLSNMQTIFNIAKGNNINVHLDGARIFNAASYLNVDVKEITKYCDSVMFCLSKGLCAPVGSILAGDKEFIEKAKKKRKLMGGGLRQAGFLAAAGIVALKQMIPKLKDDHLNALYLGTELSKIPGIIIDLSNIQINMVFFSIKNMKFTSKQLVNHFYENGIKINGEENEEMRFVTNYWVSKNDLDYVITKFKDLLN